MPDVTRKNGTATCGQKSSKSPSAAIRSFSLLEGELECALPQRLEAIDVELEVAACRIEAIWPRTTTS